MTIDRGGMKGKGRIRSLSRKGTRTGKSASVAAKTPTLHEPAVCERCGAVFSRRTWRRGRKLTDRALVGVTWVICPACEQVESSEYCGRVMVRGVDVEAMEAAMRQRIENVAARAEFTQPEHRVVSVNRDGTTLDVLTTSQKLAHRIAHELKKAFGGKTSYAWSDSDGTLSATWEARTARKSGKTGR
jgi:NMD protein affecting ribosome stability and mRNA decay